MSAISDWRIQSALIGVKEANGDPLLAMELAEQKYKSLTGRELTFEQRRSLSVAVNKEFEFVKCKTMKNNEVSTAEFSS